MIESIKIRNMGVIQSATLELGPGFIALTGETGAGKTMVLTALNLLLGGRADSSAVRKGEQQLFAEGVWHLTNQDLSSRVFATGAELEDDYLIVNRSVSSDGRSRANLGGAAVPASTLSEFAEDLVAVHGQSDQIRLRSLTAQRSALDAFGSDAVSSARDVYSRNYIVFKELESRLERMRQSGANDEQRISFLKMQIQDIEALQPSPGEVEDLMEKINRLSNVEDLRQAALSAHDSLSAEDGLDALQLISIARKAIESIDDSKLEQISRTLLEVAALTKDASADLASFLADLEADPALLESMLSRRAELIALERKYGKSLAEIIESLPILNAELLDLDSSDEQLEKLESELKTSKEELSVAAERLSLERKKAANFLQGEVTLELAELAMTGANLVIQLTPLADFESHGKDKIEFLLSSHPGADPRPLGKGASGGELSRIMLAIELVLAASQPLPTMVFDEVDAGVGGAAATKLGKRLQKLSESTQVIVVTHLPQVAAFASRQIRVSKGITGDITASSVEVLSPEEREIELARMLSGNPDSEVARAHARELLQTD